MRCLNCRMDPCVCHACTECGAGFPDEEHLGGWKHCECECHPAMFPELTTGAR